MLKASGRTTGGEPVLFLGLTGENVTRLAAGEPIHIKSTAMADLELPAMNVVLLYGRTEQAIIEEMTAHGLTLPGVAPAGG